MEATKNSSMMLRIISFATFFFVLALVASAQSVSVVDATGLRELLLEGNETKIKQLEEVRAHGRQQDH
jgi:hypothetical protein